MSETANSEEEERHNSGETFDSRNALRGIHTHKGALVFFIGMKFVSKLKNQTCKTLVFLFSRN
jgi:hypothetical protein